MTYNGVVLLVSGFQADEARILKQYDAMLKKSVLVSNVPRSHSHISPAEWRTSILADHYGS
jgi:hypothetical protein